MIWMGGPCAASVLHSDWHMCRFHIDAAFAGVTAMLPEMQHHFAGLELADSFNTNAHK